QEQHLNAREVFDTIVAHAWRTGEPGLIFIDRINALNPTRPSETIEATNPCGEQPLPPYDSCNLASINLGRFVKTPRPEHYTPARAADGIDWDKLAGTVRLGVHFLDNVIDLNRYPIPEIEAQTKKNRRIGLGVMGWADMLVRLGLPYGSDEAVALAEKVMGFIYDEARNQSSTLAKTRGRFPNWEGSIYREEGVAMRNATVTTIAPTGTISIIAGCSSGIEPYYSLAFERHVLDGTRMMEVNPLFLQVARERGFYSEELISKVAASRSIAEFSDIPEDVRALFVTAADISPEAHIRMQAAFQHHCDSSVSKTINFPESARVDDVRKAFTLAYELGCKGITIYRDNSRPEQVLSPVGVNQKTATQVETARRAVASRPAMLPGITEKIRTGYGNLYVTINTKDGQPFEVFAHIGKSGYTTMADTEAICRLISLNLRSGVPVQQVIRQLRGIGGANQVYSDGARVSSIPDAIAQVLNRHFGSSEESAPAQPAEICPDCSSAMRFEAGCRVCPVCGYSTC
ncbi:MAG: adenosylcobalamin-dependent ribonucleoside-diphosphate reductase, partial [Candidatus Zixiibacteriota bacterium]